MQVEFCAVSALFKLQRFHGYALQIAGRVEFTARSRAMCGHHVLAAGVRSYIEVKDSNRWIKNQYPTVGAAAFANGRNFWFWSSRAS